MLLVNHKIFIKNIYAFLKGRFGVPVCLFTSKLLSSKWKEGKTTLFGPEWGRPTYTLHRAQRTQGATYTGLNVCTQGPTYTKKSILEKVGEGGNMLGQEDVGGGLANNSSTKIMAQKKNNGSQYLCKIMCIILVVIVQKLHLKES